MPRAARRVLLVELDSGLRSVDYIAGVYGKTVYDVEDVLNGRCEAGKAVVESPVYRNLYVISAPYSGGHILPGSAARVCRKGRPGVRHHCAGHCGGHGRSV